MRTYKHLDWLSITIGSSASWRNFIPFADLTLMGKGRHGYGQLWQDKRTGARIETASVRDDMGTHLTLSGDVLTAMREELGALDDMIIERMRLWDAKCSRVDLAIDIFGATCTPSELNADLLAHSAHLPARTWRFIDGHADGINGSTIDTGSTTSDRRFRFYDKRAEMRIKDGEAWVRLELQLRRQYARATVGACGEHGCTAVTTASIGGYLQWSHPDYSAALAGMSDITTSIPRREANRKRWLLGQVASALADECHGDPYFLERFLQAFRYFTERKSGKVDNGNIKA